MIGAQNRDKISTPLVVLAFAMVYIVWGSTYFFIKIAVNEFPPFILGGLRFITAGILLMSWCLLKGEEVFNKQNIKYAAISGVFMLFIGNGVVMWVEQYLPSAMVAIVVSSAPIWFVMLDKPKWIENFRSKAIIAGLLIGFGGIILLFSEQVVSAFSVSGNLAEVGSVALLIMGSMAWAGGSLYSKYKLSTGSATVNTAWQILAAGVAFIPAIFISGEAQKLQWQSISTDAWLSLIYLITMGSIAGFSAYTWLLKVRPATQVSTYAYVNPVVAVLLGVFFANESISLIQILGLITILGSVLLINLAKYNRDRKSKKIGAST